MNEKKPEQRAVICIYCNIAIPYSSDDARDKIYELMKEHDKICPCNPLVAENAKLKTAIRKHLKTDDVYWLEQALK